MSDYLLLIGTILTLGLPYIAKLLSKSFRSYQAICLTNSVDKKILMNNLSSEKYLFIDLDQEIYKTLNLEEREKQPMYIGDSQVSCYSSCYYEKGMDVLDRLSNMVKNKEIVLLSSDYLLLKQICKCKIHYWIPSIAYSSFIRASQGFDNNLFTTSLNQMKQNKLQKLEVYNTSHELEKLVIDTFNNKVFRKF